MQERDTAWLETLFRSHADSLMVYVRFRCRDPELAREVVSETFLLAWRKRDRIPERDPHVWLYGTARRVLANQRRALDRRDALHERLFFSYAAAPVAHDGSEAVLDLRRALQELSETDREALVLVGWFELTHAQAAQVQKVRPSPSRYASTARGRDSSCYSSLIVRQTPTPSSTTR